MSVHCIASGQSFKERFADLFNKQDSLAMQTLLKEWEAADENDPELYAAWFNYYIIQSRNEVVVLGTEPTEEPQLAVLDTATHEPVGYLYSEVTYNPEMLEKAYEYIDRGIEKFPDRLDLRFGKVYMLGETEDYANYTREIVKAIEYSMVNGNRWTWSDNEPVESPQQVLLGNVQSYIYNLFETGIDSLFADMAEISETVLKYYPDNIESLSNMAVVNIFNENYDTALDFLFKAYKLAPDDSIILSNIAEVYRRQGDNVNALKYYDECLKYADEEMKQFVNDQIRRIKEE